MSVAVDEETFWLGDWRVEPPLNRIVRGEEIVRIDPRNMKVLQLLASQPGHVFSQAEIERAVWADVIVTSNSVYQSIAQLRRALGDGKDNLKYIETISRRGYRVIADVRRFTPVLPGERRAVPNRPHNSRSSMAFALLLGCSFVVAISVASIHQISRSNVRTQEEASIPDANPSVPLILGEVPKTAGLEPTILQGLAEAAITQGKSREAEAYLKKALHLRRSDVGDRHPIVGELLTHLSNVYLWQSDYAAAESSARAALDAFESTPKSHPGHIEATRQLGIVLMERGDYTVAEGYLNSALELSTEVFGANSRSRADMLVLVSALRHSQGRLQEAEQLATEGIAIAESLRVDSHTLGHNKSILALTLLAQQRYEEAKVIAESVLSSYGDGIRPDHPYVIAMRDILGKALIGLGDFQRAETIFRENINLWQRNDGWSRRASMSASALGEALLGQGRMDDAEVYLSRASLEIDGATVGRAEAQQLREHQARLMKLEIAKASIIERPSSTRVSRSLTSVGGR